MKVKFLKEIPSRQFRFGIYKLGTPFDTKGTYLTVLKIWVKFFGVNIYFNKSL